MIQTQVKKVSEALERAKELGEIFLTSLSRQQLERAGFDVSTFGYFESAKIYLQYYNDEYRLKYVFDPNTSEYYEKSSEVGGMENFIAIVASYLCQNTDAEGRQVDMAEIEQIERYNSEHGTVLMYKVSPIPTATGLRMEVFYIVTLYNNVTERIWGAGQTPELALEDAITQWERTGMENPFQHIYDEVYAPEREGE
jgi:hypothetical protein